MLTNEMIRNTFSRLDLTAPDEIRPTKDLLFAVQYAASADRVLLPV